MEELSEGIFKAGYSLIETDILIIGAGAVGLSCLNQLPPGIDAILIEQHSKFGQETSSRNSEVIHSGIYYPKGSLKTEHCKVGRNELYRYCRANQISHRQCGKYIVATTVEEEEGLESLAQHCEYEVIPFQRLGSEWVQRKIPFVKARMALFFPLSGIFDSHGFLSSLESKALKKGFTISYQSRFMSVKDREPWIVEVEEKGKKSLIQSKILINCAGLMGAQISNQVLNTPKYSHRFCRGRYFTVQGLLPSPLEALIYPIAAPGSHGLGIHLTPDLAGNVRLGPDVDWVTDSFFDCDWSSLKSSFVKEVSYLPGLTEDHLTPGFIGVRPKLFIDGQAYSDFLVESEGSFIHLLGIESPGLTASLSLGAMVGRLVDNLLQIA